MSHEPKLTNQPGWYPFDSGHSIGTRGLENGIIRRDEEHTSGARITLEYGGDVAPFSITCGIYGWTAHTAFFSDESKAQEGFEEMKAELVGILDIIPYENDPRLQEKRILVGKAIEKFVKRF